MGTVFSIVLVLLLAVTVVHTEEQATRKKLQLQLLSYCLLLLGKR